MATSTLDKEASDSATDKKEEEEETSDKSSSKIAILNGKSPVFGISAAKYQNVLEKQIAFLSGATHENSLILSITSDGLRALEGDVGLDEFDITINYIASILTDDQKEQGIVIVIDCRRNSQLQTIKTLIEKFASSHFPLCCKSLVLLKSTGHLSQVTSYFSKSKVKLFTPEIKEKLNVISVQDKEHLFRSIPASLLTEEFGGSLPYDHLQWIKNNVLYEKVKALRERILEKFPDVRDGLNEFEVPQSVKDAERLMTEHLKLKEFFVNYFAEIDVCIDQLTTNLLNQPEDTTHSPAAAVGVLSSADVLAYLNRTNEEIHEEQGEFDKFWATHKSRLDHMMRTCHYKRTVEKVRHLIQGHIDDLTRTELVVGESLEASLELGEKHEVFVSTCKEKMDAHMKDIQEEQIQLSNLPGGDETKNRVLLQDLNQVKQSVQVLTELYQELMKLCQQKRDLFIVAVKFHMYVRQCEQWCSSVKEFTEIHPSDDITPAKAGQLVEETDHIMKQMTQRQINALKEFAACLPEKQVKKITSKTINKCNSSREKLEQYKTKLLQLVALSYTPPTPPVAEKTQVNDDSTDGDSVQSKSIQNPLSWEPEYIDEESDPSVLRKREFIYKEIIQTEKDYIEDLKVILDSYYHEMEPEDRIPLRLRGKQKIIFGNLKELYEFHNETFLKQLELYNDHPERIGSCFIQHSSDFQLYSTYCQNRPNSEALLTESPECQSFFKEIQIRLAHQLPLNSYLIKPIQRITKYQLLLKDMIKNSSNASQSLQDLQTALTIMLQVLKNLNDSLHVVGLKGFPGTLAEQGRLLVHDPFQVWEITGHSRNLLSRSHERHVFLFEKVLIFSKKKEEVTQQKSKEKKSDSYQYKNHLQLADIQLKDQDDSQVSFVVSLHGRNRMYKLQALSKDVKDMWVNEMNRLLRNQFGLLKDVVLKSGTLNRDTADKFAKMSKSSQGKTKLFNEVVDEGHMEPKKSFSGRFKLNIRPKKKITTQASQNGAKQDNGAAGGYSVSASLGGRAKDKILIMDDQALSRSVPSSSFSASNRTRSQDDLLKDIPGEWSDDDDDDMPNTSFGDHYEILAPGMPHYYTAIADYSPEEADQGIPLQLGQEVELIGINQYTGWWWVRATNYFTSETLEGWVPASYLQISKLGD